MGRKPNQPQPGKSCRVNLLLPGELVVKVDAKRARLEAESPGMEVTRSDVIRRAVFQFVQQK